jgi:hypothetical protein
MPAVHPALEEMEAAVCAASEVESAQLWTVRRHGNDARMAVYLARECAALAAALTPVAPDRPSA